MTDALAQKHVVDEAFAQWTRRNGCKRRKLTANCRAEVGIQVIALERSNFSLSFYLRFGIALDSQRKVVQEPECDIRL
jgi:hypothetical protein